MKDIDSVDKYYLQCREFIEYASNLNKSGLTYDEYIVGYDIINGSWHEIENSLYKGKITIEQVKKVFDLACSYIDNLSEKFFRIERLEAKIN